MPPSVRRSLAVPLAVCACLAAARARAAGASHSIQIRLTEGAAVYVQSVPVVELQQAGFRGQVAPAKGDAKRLLARLMAVPDADHPGAVRLEYVVDLAGYRNAPLPGVHAEGALDLRPGSARSAVDCGAWRLDLALDADGAPAGSDFGADDGNLRLGVQLTQGAAARQWKQTQLPGLPGTVSSGPFDDRRTLALLATPAAGGVSLKYDLFQSTTAGRFSPLASAAAPLAFGQAASASGPGYSLSLLAEGAASQP